MDARRSSTSCKKYGIDLLGEVYGSQECPRNIRGAYIQAYLDVDPSTAEPTQKAILRPGLVQYYLRICFDSPERMAKTWWDFFAFVRWYDTPEQRSISFERHGMTVWHQAFAPVNWTCILPVHRIYVLTRGSLSLGGQEDCGDSLASEACRLRSVNL